MGHVFAGFVQGFFLGQCRERGLAGAHKAACLQLGDRVERCAVHGALFLLHAPAPRLLRQLEHHTDAAQRAVQQQEREQQQDGHHVQ